MRFLVVVALAFTTVLPTAMTVHAQSDGYALTGINFNFTNPGARARGIGGAFVAIADDSTAALANPAGLAYLEREFTLEGAYDEDEYPVGQLTQGDVTLTPEPAAELWTTGSAPHRVRAASSSTRVNYASLLLPVARFRMNIGVYYATLADMAAEFRVGPGLICIREGTASLLSPGQECRWDFFDPEAVQADYYFGQEVRYSLRTRLLGTAMGIRVSDTLSLGVSVAMAQTEFDGVATLDRTFTGVDNVTQVTEVDGEDFLYSLGVLYRKDYWGFGINYRSETDFETQNDRLSPNGEPLENSAFSSKLSVPDRLAVGVALFPTDNWVISAEVDRISYSDVLAGMAPFNPAAEPDRADVQYRVSDVTEYHLGAEYTTFSQRRGWSVRFGYWRDTTHLPWVDEEYRDARVDDENLRARESLVRARSDEDVHHFTAGMGMSDGRRIRVDFAVDYTERSGTDVLLSAVLYF